MKQDMMG